MQIIIGRMGEMIPFFLALVNAMVTPFGKELNVSAARPSGGLPWIVAGVLAAVAAVALWAPWRAEKPVDRPLVRLDVDLGRGCLVARP